MLRIKGFSLMELMIAVAIVAILGAIAYPSYQDSVRKSRRADAKGALSELAQWMERGYSQGFDYRTVTLPFTKTPKDAPDGSEYYKLELETVDRNSFKLVAKPVNAQQGDKCKTLTLNQTGKKGVENTSLGVEDCW